MSIDSKSKGVHEVRNSLFPSAEAEAADAADAVPSLLTPSAGQRIEQMYELADIFASIFEALAYEHEHAIAITRKAA
jgi:hypothetical protein